MLGPEDVEEDVVGAGVGVVVHAHHLGVARAAAADVAVGRGVAVAEYPTSVRATPGRRWYTSSTLQKQPAANCARARPSPAGASPSGARAGLAASAADMAAPVVVSRSAWDGGAGGFVCRGPE